MGLNNQVPARDAGYQNIQYLYKKITYADDGKTVDVGTLPEGALILKPLSGVHVQVAFNGGTTNTLDIGPSTDSGTDLWATVLALGTIGFVPLDEVVSNIVGSGQGKVQAKVVSTASASAGIGHIVIAFLNPVN
ncbi:hypothetical protein [Mesorhizobium sp. B2-3-2]|uniref:hypothetical protein n=1 Tax=Mesorhizobium sp. B2-3-2 TaxID=2589961 RepID=UPI001129890A|nr:hypothetical protein [Mesorhizobium sp. B2-3-2]TPM37046.1 hypothetical protein FJ964_30395 [Mesorhizobium sp. B2-3-2]